MRHRHTHIVIAGLALLACTICAAASAKESQRPGKRARPPKWTDDVLNVFFDDARKQLVGERPEYAKIASENKPALSASASPLFAGTNWSKLIDAETIETEIKRLAQELSGSVKSPGEFKAGAYENCRMLFSELAVLFAVAAEYDAEVRWKESAPGLRDLFARAGHNCKVGTDQTFNESNQRKQDLLDLISGTRPTLAKAEKESDWAQVADRPPLMQRLNRAHQDRLTKWLANQKQFEESHDEVRHEAQVMATIADVIGREGFDYWDEDEYAKPLRQLREAATEISQAVELNNYEKAQSAINRATKACADCHDLYRG